MGVIMVARASWGKVEGWRSVTSIVTEWGAIAAVLVLAIYLNSALAYVIAVVLLGALQHRLAALGHEAAHGTLFRFRFWNDVTADAFCFFPILGTVHNYRRWHLAHHASPNDPDRDPDILNLGPLLMRDRFPMSRRLMVRLVFWRWISAPASLIRYGIEYMKLNTFGVGKGLGSTFLYQRWYSPRIASVARVAFYVALGLVLAAISPRIALLVVALWVVPLATTFPYFLMLRDTFQHTNADAGRYTNTRVFRVHPIVRWAVFPYGQDLHLPHHASPSVPHYRLEALHHHLLESRAGYGPAAVECRGVLWNRTGEPTISDVLTQGH